MADMEGNLWLCMDCTFAAEGFSKEELGTILDFEPLKDIPANWWLLPHFDSESGIGIVDFAQKWCDGCERNIGDRFHRYSHIER